MSHLGQVKIKKAKGRGLNLEKFAFQFRLPLMTNDTQLLLEEKRAFQSLRFAAFFKRSQAWHKWYLSSLKMGVGRGGGNVTIQSNFVPTCVMCYLGIKLQLSGE